MVENLVLLCALCHEEAPDVGDPRYLLDWIERREPWGGRLEAMQEAVRAAGLEDVIHGLSDQEIKRSTELYGDLMRSWAGTHGSHFSKATMGALLVEAFRRLQSELTRASSSA
jgi:hypothetical protein